MPNSILKILAQGAPAYGQGVDPAIPWARIVLAFLFCITIAVGAALWLRARQGQPTDLRILVDRLTGPRMPVAPQEMEIEQRLRVSPTSQIILLRCGARRYLVHMGPQGAQLLDRLDQSPVATEAGA